MHERKKRTEEGKHLYTTRLQKGGALLDDMRRLLLEWDGEPGCAERLLESNVLSSPSRARARDVIARTFVPRFVRSSPPNLWRPVSVLERAGWPLERLLPLHYYLAAVSEPLLWDFVVEHLASREGSGRSEVSPVDVLRFLADAPLERFSAGRWTQTVSTKVARGLLVALRDFGVLSGSNKKHLATLLLPLESFCFLALIRRNLGIRGRDAISDPCWKLFFLSEIAVERFFTEAHQRKLLTFEAAGSLVRLEFPVENPEEYAHVLVERAV